METKAQFKTISQISINNPSTWEGKIFLTFDVDWAHDDVLKDTIEIVDKYKRDEELNYLRGCSDKLFNKINVEFEYTFEKMIHEMVDYHISNIKIV